MAQIGRRHDADANRRASQRCDLVEDPALRAADSLAPIVPKKLGFADIAVQRGFGHFQNLFGSSRGDTERARGVASDQVASCY